jgi:hypothetical protein
MTYESPRARALRTHRTLSTIYQELWAGRVAGAHQDSRGRWRIPCTAQQAQPAPIADWKMSQANDDED